MKKLRYATEEEIRSIAQKADYNPSAIVLAQDTPHGPILSVVKQVIEVDPVHYPEGCEDRFKLLSANNVEAFLMGKGVSAYYFNIWNEMEDWQIVVKNYGAEQISMAPEVRFKKVIQ
jgi:hypothetical protein